jgi:hypothetical protein
MHERRNDVFRAVAILVSVGGLIVSGCVGQSTVGSGAPPVQASAPADQPDPARGPCGGAIVLVARHDPAADGGIACATTPLASGSPWPVTIRGAAAAFREFTGEATLPMEVRGPFGTATRRSYEIGGEGLNSHGLFVSGAVDADTGRVMSVEYTPRAVDGPGPQKVPADAAIANASKYLTAHSLDVAGLARSVAPTERGWEITWQRLDGSIGLPPRVMVTIEWVTGEVVVFDATTANSVPSVTSSDATIPRSRAETVALGETWLASPVVEDAQLRLDVDGDGNPYLAWVVYISGKGDRTDGPTYITIRIDAVTAAPR